MPVVRTARTHPGVRGRPARPPGGRGNPTKGLDLTAMTSLTCAAAMKWC